MFARSATSERTATLSSRWTASASRESAPKADPPSIADRLRIRSAFRLIRAPPSQSQVTDETGFGGIASRLHAAVKPSTRRDEEPLCHSVFALAQICTNVANIVSRDQNKVVRCSLLAESFTCAGRIRAHAASGV